MNPSLLTPLSVIVQGITGSHGSFHTGAMIEAGVPIIAGTSPNKAGEVVHTVPVFNAIKDIKDQFGSIECSIIFVPATHAKGALLEAIYERIPLIICITEGIPLHDMIIVKQEAIKYGVTLIGPNCPGILLPNVTKLGIIPTTVGLPGKVGVVSRSGTLTYEVTANLTNHGIGQRYIIGIGGDSIHGVSFVDCLQLFQNDPHVETIIMIGEIGGTSEQTAATYIKTHVTKPVHAYIAGHHAPKGIQMGHAGALIGSDYESARVKTEILKNAGAKTADSIPELLAMITNQVY